ncbi:hypothetical protein PV797_13995 [Clostridiaceae bacterium M8S5]|nr:hypothetical protein PV797_13995 [Clostridiaceae bacterium M8S5]
MFNLLKYEVYKKYKTLLASLTIIAIIELICIYYLYDSFNKAGSAIIIYTLLGIAGMVFLLVENINTYKSDLFKKSGYMLFLTPNNGYKILGSKVIFSLVENIVGFLIYFSLGLMNYKILLSNYTEHEVLRFFSTIQQNLSHYDISILNVFYVCLIIVFAWFNFTLSIYLAMTIYKSVLSNVKRGGLISFGLFLVINFFIQKFYDLFFSEVFNIDFTTKSMLFPSLFTLGIVSVALFFSTSYLLDKKVNL